MPKISDEKKEARRQQIIAAAYQTFSEKGFGEATMRDIFRNANLSAGAVYSYFENKEAIVLAVCKQRTSKYIGHLEGMSGAHPDTAELLAELVAEFATGFGNPRFDQQARLHTQLWSIGLSRDSYREEMNAIFDDYANALGALISRAQTANQIDQTLDATMIAQVVMTLIFGLEIRMSFNPSFDAQNFADTVRALFRGTFRTTG